MSLERYVKTKYLSWVLPACLFLASLDTLAADLSVAFVNTAKVLKVAPQAEAARKRLESTFAPRDKKIVQMQKQVKRLEEKRETDSAVMSDAQLRKIQREIKSLKRDIKRAKEEFSEDLNLRRNEELGKLQKLVYDTIVRVAKEEKVDVVLGDSVLFASKRIDITKKVLDKLHKDFRGNSNQ